MPKGKKKVDFPRPDPVEWESGPYCHECLPACIRAWMTTCREITIVCPDVPPEGFRVHQCKACCVGMAYHIVTLRAAPGAAAVQAAQEIIRRELEPPIRLPPPRRPRRRKA